MTTAMTLGSLGPIHLVLLAILIAPNAIDAKTTQKSSKAEAFCEWDVLDGQRQDEDLQKDLIQLITSHKPVLIRNASSGAWTSADWQTTLDAHRELAELQARHLGQQYNSTKAKDRCPAEPHKLPPYIFEQQTMPLRERGRCRGEYSQPAKSFQDAVCAILDKVPLPFLTSSLLMRNQMGTSVGWTFGGPCAGLIFHRHAPAMSLLLQGEKRWMVEPNREQATNRTLMDHVYNAFSDDKTGTGGTDRGEKYKWLQRYYPLADFSKEKWHFTGPRSVEPLHCIQRPGDLVMLPNYHYHAVMNVEDSFSLVYLPCLSFVEHHALSGCGLREDPGL